MIAPLLSLVVFLGLAPLPQQEEAVLRVFDINDLLAPAEGAEDVAKARALRTEAFAGAIRNFIQPPLKEGSEHITAVGSGTLMVQARAKQQDWIASLLELQRQAGALYFLIDVKYYRLTEEALKRHHPNGDNPSTVFNLKAEEIPGAVDFLEKDADVKLVTAPRLLVRNAEKGGITMMTETPFLTGYEIHENVEPIKTRVVDPVIETKEEGFEFDGCAILLDKAKIGLSLKITQKMIQRPYPEIKTEYGVTTRPVTRTVSIENNFVLVDGTALGQSVLGEEDQDNPHLLLISVKKVPAAELSTLDLKKD